MTLNRQRFLKQDIKEPTVKTKRNDKWVDVKVKNIYLSKDPIKRVKR